ncbi:hemicentin-2-like [Brienomyrus brachyistius]|uniref:hemicentin-2-like n=1 Tax=Brienomyrus brachyistius TaxID=42636 RepID=UPI0020B2E6BC|nr:hemicentin-2-like [Brienomyrus brachyistius]
MLSLLTFLGLEQMLGRLRAAVLTYFLWMHLSAAELFFTAPPEDLVGLPDGPLVLPCPAYSPNQKGAHTVHWERGSGTPLPGPEERIHQLSNGSLFFSHLWEEDFGIYLCHVQDGTDRIRATVRVKKAGMEAVFFSPKSQLVPEGDSVFLQCISGDSRPPAHITWEKDGSPLTKGTQIQGEYGGGSHLKTTGTLYLADVSKDDEGEYICVTHNPLLSIRLQSAAATVTVQGRHATPKIIKGPENITVAMDTEASLHCDIQGFPLPMVHWFKNSVPLQNDSRRRLSNNGQLLVFSKVSEEDEGFYHCEARGLKTSVRSQPAYLQTAEMEWSFMQQPVNTTAQAGNSVTLTCRPPRSRPPARVTWFKNGRPLTHKPHFSQLPSGDLLFHRLQEADRGSYFCRASNSLLPRAVSSRKAYLNVQASPSVTLWPKLVTTVLGSRVTLHCQVSGYPLPRITWSKQGRSVQTGGRVTLGINNATLYFSSVKAFDEGSYTCHATNTVGRAQGTASVRVAVSPVIISFLREVRSSVGVSVVLPCQAVGSSPIRYTWNQGPGHTPISSSSRIHVDEDGMLNITRLERPDAGEYHCIAENVAGRDQRTANIIVLAEEDATERGRVSTATLKGCTPFQNLLSNYKCQQTINISASTGRTLADRMLVNGNLSEVTARNTRAAGSIKIGSSSNSSEPSGFRSSTLTPEDIGSVVRPVDITDHPAQGSAPSPSSVWIPAILSESTTVQVTLRDGRVRSTPVSSPGSEQTLVSEKTGSQMTLGLSELGRGHSVAGLPPSFHLQPVDLQTPSSEVYSPPAFFHSKSIKNQTPLTYLYSSPTFFHSTLPDNQSPPSYQYSPPTTFQSHSTENQTPSPDLHSPPTTFQSHSTENQTENPLSVSIP